MAISKDLGPVAKNADSTTYRIDLSIFDASIFIVLQIRCRPLCEKATFPFSPSLFGEEPIVIIGGRNF